MAAGYLRTDLKKQISLISVKRIGSNYRIVFNVCKRAYLQEKLKQNTNSKFVDMCALKKWKKRNVSINILKIRGIELSIHFFLLILVMLKIKILGILCNQWITVNNELQYNLKIILIL